MPGRGQRTGVSGRRSNEGGFAGPQRYRLEQSGKHGAAAAGGPQQGYQGARVSDAEPAAGWGWRTLCVVSVSAAPGLGWLVGERLALSRRQGPACPENAVHPDTAEGPETGGKPGV